MMQNPNVRIAGLAAVIYILDQVTKLVVLNSLSYGERRIIIDGFFQLVHWGNTGAAWSMFHGNNTGLAAIGAVALVILFLIRRHFEIHTLGGQICLGLIFGGILGNLTDRLVRNHVIDFLYFYVIRRDNDEAGFPAFNVADTAICIGVGLLFVFSWRNQGQPAEAKAP